MSRPGVVKTGTDNFVRVAIDRDKAMSWIEGFIGFGENETVFRIAGKDGWMMMGFIPVVGGVMDEPGDVHFFIGLHRANGDHVEMLTSLRRKWELLREPVRP